MIVSQDQITIVKGIELGNSTYGLDAATKGEVAVVNDESQAFGVEKSLVSFSVGVSAAKRWDVLDTVLFAQLAADKQFSIHEQTTEWYARYTDVLKTLGWVTESDVFGKKEMGEGSLEVRSEILNILKDAFGVSSIISIANSVLNSIKSLEDKDKTIIAFKRSIMKDEKGAFQIAHAEEKDGVISMLSGVFRVTASKTTSQILFFRSSKEFTGLSYNVNKSTLQEANYSTVKEVVVQKLGTRRTASTFEIEI